MPRILSSLRDNGALNWPFLANKTVPEGHVVLSAFARAAIAAMV